MDKQGDMLRISIRFPSDEVERIDAAAREAGMSRSDYIRYQVRAPGTNRTVEVLGQLAETLRALQVTQGDYMKALSSMLEMLEECDEAIKAKALCEITEVEIPAARELCVGLRSLEADVSRAMADLRAAASDVAARKM